jgi:hypothetical protein
VQCKHSKGLIKANALVRPENIKMIYFPSTEKGPSALFRILTYFVGSHEAHYYSGSQPRWFPDTLARWSAKVPQDVAFQWVYLLIIHLERTKKGWEPLVYDNFL